MKYILFGLLLVFVINSVNSVEFNDDDIIDEKGSLKEIKMLNQRYPNSDDLKLMVALLNKVHFNKYALTIRKHKDYTHFDQVLNDLKTTFPSAYDKVKPYYELNKKNYEALDAASKNFMDKCFANIWLNQATPLVNGVDRLIITKEQAAELRKIFNQLTAQQKDAIKTKFPVVVYFVEFALGGSI